MKQRPTLVEIGNYVDGTHLLTVGNESWGVQLEIVAINDDYNKWQLSRPGAEIPYTGENYVLDEHQAEALRDALTVHLRRLRAEERKLRQSQEEA